LPSSEGAREIVDKYKSKIEGNVIPPDPLRLVEGILRLPVTVEHVLPIPPVLEYVHSNFTQPLVEALPRLPLTADFPDFKWLEWRKEELRL
jgi:hypothetical protein